MENHRYNRLPNFFPEDITDALSSNDTGKLKHLVISAALYWDDSFKIQTLCEKLATHPNDEVRGNAILGFGHISRRFRSLSEKYKPLIQAGLSDNSEYVVWQSNAAADDLIFFLGWTFDRAE